MAQRNREGTSSYPAAQLEQLVRDLAERQGVYALMREHLQAARVYLLGSMPREYGFSLKLVEELLQDIDDEPVKSRIAELLSHK